MEKCRRCQALFTGRTNDGLCPVCFRRNRQRIFSDPADKFGWSVRQIQRSRYLEGEPVIEATGLCPICRRPLDDHKLLYSPKPYALGLCEAKK